MKDLYTKKTAKMISVFGCFVPTKHEWAKYVDDSALFDETGHRILQASPEDHIHES